MSRYDNSHAVAFPQGSTSSLFPLSTSLSINLTTPFQRQTYLGRLYNGKGEPLPQKQGENLDNLVLISRQITLNRFYFQAVFTIP